MHSAVIHFEPKLGNLQPRRPLNADQRFKWTTQSKHCMMVTLSVTLLTKLHKEHSKHYAACCFQESHFIPQRANVLNQNHVETMSDNGKTALSWSPLLQRNFIRLIWRTDICHSNIKTVQSKAWVVHYIIQKWWGAVMQHVISRHKNSQFGLLQEE